jgi:hypothetical protein
MTLMRLWIFGLLLTTMMQAESRSDNAIFEVPRGWRCEERPDALVLVAPEAESLPTVTIRLTRSRESKGNLSGLFTTAVRTSIRNARILHMGRMETIQSPDGFAMKALTVRVKQSDGSVAYRTFVGANPNGRFEFVEYSAPNDILQQKYRPALNEFLQALTFASAVEY